jgi:hypothetical protein
MRQIQSGTVDVSCVIRIIDAVDGTFSISAMGTTD